MVNGESIGQFRDEKQQEKHKHSESQNAGVCSMRCQGTK